MYKKAWCTCKVVVLRNKPIAFLTSSLPSPLSLLKLPNDFKMPRRRRQRERQKSNRLNRQNNNSARAAFFFVHFFAVTEWRFRGRRRRGILNSLMLDPFAQPFQQCLGHTSALPMVTGCILPTMHWRPQHCWKFLHPFANHCQHGRNNSQQCWPHNVGSFCVRPFARSLKMSCFCRARLKKAPKTFLYRVAST